MRARGSECECEDARLLSAQRLVPRGVVRTVPVLPVHQSGPVRPGRAVQGTGEPNRWRFGIAKRFPLSEESVSLRPESVFDHSNARENALRSWREREKSLSHPIHVGPKNAFPYPLARLSPTQIAFPHPPAFKSKRIPRRRRQRACPRSSQQPAVPIPSNGTLPHRPHRPHRHHRHCRLSAVSPIEGHSPIAPIFATDLPLMSLPHRTPPRHHPAQSPTLSPHAPRSSHSPSSPGSSLTRPELSSSLVSSLSCSSASPRFASPRLSPVPPVLPSRSPSVPRRSTGALPGHLAQGPRLHRR